MKKKLLYLSQLYPYPPISGGRIKTLNTIVTLAKQYDVFAVFISEDKPSKEEIKKLTALGVQVKVFYSSTILASVKDDLPGVAKKFLQGIPHYVFQYTHAPAFPFIANVIKTFKPDVIHVDHLNMAQYLPQKKREVWVLEHHNVETYLYWTRFIHTTKFFRKIYLGIELVLTYFYELRMLALFDHVFAISLPEEKRVRHMFKITRISTQIPVYQSVALRQTPHKNPRLLFIGVLGWPPNEDALEWFVADIFPVIRKAIPSIEFHIVGQVGVRYQPKKNKGVIYHGFQKNLLSHLSGADVFILPFRMGGGLRLKSLTALSAGLPLVSTPLGVEGLNVLDGVHFIKANTASEFASRTVDLLKNKSLLKKLRLHARQYVDLYHGEKQNSEYLRVYKGLLKHL